MNPAERIPRWLEDLRATLGTASELAARGRESFDSDPALALAFEALSNRVGELAKRLIAADPEGFRDPIWRQAARQRDFVVHHYDRTDADLRWGTITESFPKLAEVVRVANASVGMDDRLTPPA